MGSAKPARWHGRDRGIAGGRSYTGGVTAPSPLTVLLARPRGFCAGVERAIDVVEIALQRKGPPVYVRHAIVHNNWVVSDLERKGAIFVEDESEVPEGEMLVFSAHGVAPSVKKNAEDIGLRTIDATCPLVTKVHHEVRHHAERGDSIILVGHRGHVEMKGTSGVAPERTWIVETPEEVDALDLPDPERVAYATQTTLSVEEANRVVEAILARFPHAKGPRGDDICYATQNRQDATKELARRSELVLVVGSTTSSNSKRMVEVALEHGAPDAHLIDGPDDIDPAWLEGADTVGLTSGASAPDLLVNQVIEHLQGTERGAVVQRLDVIDEQMQFALPKELRYLTDPEELSEEERPASQGAATA